MLVKRIAACTHLSSTVITSYSVILVLGRKLQLFPTPLHLMPPLGCCHWNSRKKFGSQKTRIMWLPGSEDSLTIGWAVSSQYQCVTDERTDRQTDRRPAYSVKTFWIWRHSLCKFLENFMSHQALTTFWYQYMTTIWYRLNSGQKWDPFFQFGATLASITLKFDP